MIPGQRCGEEPDEEEKDLFCSGTLIDEDVFLTAAHCTEALRSMDIGPEEVWVTFDPTFDQSSPLVDGTYVSHPGYSGRQDDPKDIAVILLEEEQDATPVRLPEANELRRLRDEGVLDRTWFTAVGTG